MCRATSVKGGRRCPSHQDPGTRRGALLRQQIGRYGRRVDAVETELNARQGDPGTPPGLMDRLTARMDRHLGKFSAYLAAYSEHENRATPPPPAPPLSATRAGEFTPESTIAMSDADLADKYHQLATDPEAQDAVMAVMDWRDERAAERDAEVAAMTRNDTEAWSDATFEGPPNDTLHNPARRTAARSAETKHQQIRTEYEVYVHSRYLAAEDECRGVMVNAEGRARGIDPLTLFSGNATRASRWASPELKNYWRKNGRMTLARFRHETYGWDSDRAAATRNLLEDYGDAA